MDPVRVDLYWLPLGAGEASGCVRWNGRIFEVIMARQQHREVCDLYHSALVVHLGGIRYVIEMAPAWANSADRLASRPQRPSRRCDRDACPRPGPGWSAGLLVARRQDAIASRRPRFRRPVQGGRS